MSCRPQVGENTKSMRIALVSTSSFPRTTLLVAFIVSALGYPVLFLSGALEAGGLMADRARLQLLALPLVIALFSQIKVCGQRMPRLGLGLVAVAGLGGAVFTYTHVDLAEGAFVIARLTEDELGSESKITRDRVRQVVGREAAALVGTHHAALQSVSEARALLDSDGHLGGVMWGTPRWVTLSLAREPEITLDRLVPEKPDRGREWQKLRAMKVVTAVPRVGMSGSSDPATVEFVGKLVPMWRIFYSALLAPEEYPSFEQSVRNVSAIKARWTSFSHRALPMWMTGSYHLVRALGEDVPEYGEIQCALAAFKAARAQLRPGDNVELEAAVFNNHGVAVFADSLVSGHPKRRRKLAATLLRRALALSRRSEDETLRRAVRANVTTLKGKRQGARMHGKARRRKS